MILGLLRWRTQILAPLITLVTLAGCGGSVTVRVAEPSGTVQAHTGDTLVMSFGASPGVGYGWTLHAVMPPASLSLVSDRFQADHPGAVGGSGSQIFTFKAHKAGTVQLTFRHFFRGRLLEQRQVAVTLS
jgi:predicted secreted protein